MSKGTFSRLRSPLLLAFALALSSCTTGAYQDTPGFGAGYADGCASAARGAVPRRDAGLYADDPDYRAGWQSGRLACATPDNEGLGQGLGPGR